MSVCLLSFLVSSTSQAGFFDSLSELFDGPYTSESIELFDDLFPECSYPGKKGFAGVLSRNYPELYMITLYGRFHDIEELHATLEDHEEHFPAIPLKIIAARGDSYHLLVERCPARETENDRFGSYLRDLGVDGELNSIKILKKD